MPDNSSFASRGRPVFIGRLEGAGILKPFRSPWDKLVFFYIFRNNHYFFNVLAVEKITFITFAKRFLLYCEPRKVTVGIFV